MFSRFSLALVCSAFFASGAAALAFETLWFHQAALVFGSSVWASSIVLSGFMAGMAAGGIWASRIGERVASPLLAFVVLELVVGVSGLAIVHGLPWLTPLAAAASASFESAPVALNLLRFIAAFAVLVVPSTAMGMTLPLLARGLHGGSANFGRVLGGLYGVNTLGALAGVLATESLLVPRLGIRHTALAALGANGAAAGLAWLARGGISAPPIATSVRFPVRGVAWLIAGFGSGLAMLGLEVVWLRCLTLFLNDTPLAFALVLSGVLAGLALGSLTAGAWAARADRAGVRAGFAAIAAAAAGVATYRAYAYVLAEAFHPDQEALTILAIAWPLIVPTAIASGALFTWLGTGLQRELEGDAVAVGRLAFANLVGGGAGSMLAGFVLLPRLGMERSLFVLLLVFAASGVFVIARKCSGWRIRAAAGVVALLALGLFPWGVMQRQYVTASAGRFMRPGDRVVRVREGLTGTIVHVEHRMNGVPVFDHLGANAYAMTANDFAARRYMKQFVYLPRALHPQLQRALIVGYGIGSTAAALTEDAALREIDIADISRDILDMSRSLRAGPAKNPLADPRVRVHLEDGRQLLAAHGKRYDLITGEPPPPVIAGVVNLYTRDYFQLVRGRLAEGGMATHWLPLMNLSAPAARSIIRAFCDAFDDCSLWHGSARNFMLFGTRNASGPVPEERFTALWHDPGTLRDLSRVGFERPEQLGAAFIGDAEYLRTLTQGDAPVTDDAPRLIQQSGPIEDRDALIWQWRDTNAARARFMSSPWIAKLFPSELRTRSAKQFENQRLLNDLLFPERTGVRQTQVLHQVLHGTQLRLPVLLMLNSDPDVQDRLDDMPESARSQPHWLPHRLAGYLAERDFTGALAVLRMMPPEKVPLPDLLEYVEFVVERGGGKLAPPR